MSNTMEECSIDVLQWYLHTMPYGWVMGAQIIVPDPFVAWITDNNVSNYVLCTLNMSPDN